MKIDVVQFQNLIEGSHLDKDHTHTKTCVPIILIIESNMLCINVLTCIHNFSMDRKFEVNQHARFKY